MKIKKSFVKRKIGEKYLVVNTNKESGEQSMFIEMNETSSVIWDMLDKEYDEEKIAKQLSSAYSVDIEKAKSDVHSLISSMQAAGIFEDWYYKK